MSKYKKEDIIGLIDLTSLNAEDNDESIKTLCKKASNGSYSVAAVCIYKEFLPLAKRQLAQDISLATVVNFPKGGSDISMVLSEVEIAIKNGANEIDLVMPYSRLIDGDIKFVERFIQSVKEECRNHVLKVIIESGELKTERLIREASKISINCGADFIKTSTGKVEINATLDSAKYMLEEIKLSGSSCGFKASGGIKTEIEAVEYLDLTKAIMGEKFINKKTFRFGASSLLNDLLKQSSVSNY